MKRLAAGVLALVLLCGCLPVKLTPAEQIEQDIIVEQFNGAVGKLNSALVKVDAARETITELVAKHADVIDQIKAVVKAIEEKRIPVAEGTALIAKLSAMKDELADAKDEVEGLWESAKADADVAVAEVKDAEVKVKAFEASVRKRVEDETGKDPGGFWVLVGGIVALVTGGGGYKVVTGVRGLMATVRKLKAGFKVTAGTLADLNSGDEDGKASAEAKAKIRERLALTIELDEKELEVLRREALDQ